MRGLTQTDPSRLVGISFQSVQKYERGENRVSASRLHEFAIALGVPEQFFFEGAAGVETTEVAAPVLALRERSMSASEGKEFHRQLEALMAIEDRRMRTLTIQLLKLLTEAAAVAPPAPAPIDVTPEP